MVFRLRSKGLRFGFLASYKIEKNTCGIPQVRKKNEASRTSIVETPFKFSKYSYSQHSRCNVNSALHNSSTPAMNTFEILHRT